MQISYAGKISKDDFWKAIVLHNNQQYRVYKWVMGVAVAIFVLSVVFLAFQNSPVIEEVFRYAFPGGLIPLAAMTFPWWAPFLQLSSYNQKGNIYRNNVFGSIDNTGITIKTNEVNASFPWSAFENCRRSKDILMLYQNKNCFNLLVPSMFSNSEDWEKVVSLAQEKVAINKKSA